MFYVTKKGSYSIRALLQLATNIEDKGRTHIGEVAKQTHIPEPFLRKIFASLAKAGIVKSQRGLTGGIKLLKKIEDVSVFDIVEAVEGELSIYKCLNNPGICRKSGNCLTQFMWQGIQDTLKETLKNVTVASLYDEEDIKGCIFPNLGVKNNASL